MESATSTPKGSERVLLVDDEASVRKVVRMMLERLGYRVVEASNGAEALGILETSLDRIDLVITDVVMPDLHGGDLGEVLLAREPWRRVLYMSGYPGDEIVRHGITRHGARLLNKPFTADALARAVRDALDLDATN